jgi:hypothetical protein
MGLAIDGSQMYAHRQMAQAAADAAAGAGISTMFVGTYSVPTGGAAHTCTDSDAATISNVFGSPCYYAQKNGFLTADDTVVVSFPSSPFNGVTGSSSYTYPFIQVTITRTVHTSFMRFLGSSTASIKATAGAGIVQTNSAVPILVLHPTKSGAISLGGSSTITICGGPTRSIQVNSSSSSAVSVGHIDISHAGTADTSGNCTLGTGGDFGVYGGPTSKPSGINIGSGHYVQPAAPIPDPLASVSAPTRPVDAPAKTPLANGVGGCPASPKKACNLYSPGYYSSDLQVKLETAVLKPGLYYIDGSFSNSANGDVYPCQNVGGISCGSPGLTGNTGTGNGVVVYLHGNGSFDFTANSDLTLSGSDNASTYKGILFFSDRSAVANTHSLGGGGVTNLTGTIYLVNTLATKIATPSHYQTLSLGGGSGSGTTIRGEIITDAISMSGSSSITMNLDPTYTLPVDQVALVK